MMDVRIRTHNSVAGLSTLLLLLLGVPAASFAARPDLKLDAEKRVLQVSYIPRTPSGTIRVGLWIEDDASRRELESRELSVVRGRRFNTVFAVPTVRNCIFHVQILDGKERAEEAIDLYRPADRTPNKLEQIVRLLMIGPDSVGKFLGKLTGLTTLKPTGKDLFRLDLEKRTVTRITTFEGGGLSSPRVSSDGSRVAFVRDPGGEDPEEVWIIHVVGDKPMRIDQATRFDRGTSPVWSPDGESLFYLRQGKLYKRNLAGGPAQEQPHPGVDALSQLLGWVRDSSGQLLATSRIGTEVEQIWLIDPKSGEATRLPYDVAYLWLPNLSPDGKSLVHSKYAGAGSRTKLYLRRPDGKDEPLTKDDHDDEYPCWSPDGKSIVFVSDRP